MVQMFYSNVWAEGNFRRDTRWSLIQGGVNSTIPCTFNLLVAYDQSAGDPVCGTSDSRISVSAIPLLS